MNEIAAIVTVIFFTESIAPESQEEKDLNSSNVSQKYYNLNYYYQKFTKEPLICSNSSMMKLMRKLTFLRFLIKS